MSPKIEELDDAPIEKKVPLKNPFAIGQKKKTIKREASEIYPEKKGLNKPQFTRNKPIDVVFEEIQRVLNGPLNELTIESLDERLFGPVKSENSSPFDITYRVMGKLTELLLEVQKCALEEESKASDTKIIAVSLHDIKTFSKLISVLIIFGIYPVLHMFKIGIPIEKRRLKDFGKEINKPLRIPGILMTYDECFTLMMLLHSQLFKIFLTSSDIKELMMRGTGVSDFLVLSMALYSIPEFKQKEINFQYDDQIESIPDTFELFQTYNLLLASPCPPYFRSFVLEHLQKLPYKAPRNDGVLTLVEFVLGLRDQEEIQVEKYEHVAQILLLKPKSISTVEYFTSIGDQMYNLLVDINKPAVTSCLVFVVERLWERNKLVTQDFIFKPIWRIFNPEPVNKNDDRVLVSETQWNNNINVLLSLTLKALNDDLLITLFSPIIVSLWSYITFLKSNKKSFEVAQGILVSYLSVLDDKESKQDTLALDLISKNLVNQGGENWMFEYGLNGLPQLVKCDNNDKLSFESKDKRVNDFLNNLESCCTYFVELLENLDDTQVSRVFSSILKRWLTTKSTSLNEENPFFVLIDLRLLEVIGQKFTDAIAKSPTEMLQLIVNFLAADDDKLQVYGTEGDADTEMDSDDEDMEIDSKNSNESEFNILSVVLELLSAILTESSVELDEDGMKLLLKIDEQLKMKANSSSSTGLLSPKIKDSLLALSERIKELQSQDAKVITDEKEIQKRVFKRAIVSLNDPLVPIRAHGLYLLRQLIEQRSEVLTLDFVINLHLIQLKDLEPFVYLNVIKGLTSLIEWNPQQVLPKLTQIYSQEEGTNDLDERLRIGEVLLNFIQTSNELFGGETAQLITEASLLIISRHQDKRKDSDDRIRMSAMSLMGVCCKTNPLGIVNHLTTALDCSFGILQLEIGSESAIMRRAAVVLIHDLILGTSKTDKVIFPSKYREQTVVVLRYITETDNDLLVREQAQAVLDTIEELTRLAFELLQEASK